MWRVLVSPGSEVASTVIASCDTSRMRERTVYSMRAFKATPVSWVEPHPPSVRRWAISHRTIGSTNTSRRETYTSSAYPVVSMFCVSNSYGKRGKEKYFWFSNFDGG